MWRTCRAVGHDPVTLRLPPVLRGCRAQFPHAVPHRQPRGGVPRKASARGALSGAPFRRGGTCSGHRLSDNTRPTNHITYTIRRPTIPS